MTPQEQRNKRFDEKFPKSEYFEDHARLSFEGADDKVKDFLTSEVNLAIEQVERWAEENRDTDGCTGTGVDCGSKKYNQALDDLLTFLKELKK